MPVEIAGNVNLRRLGGHLHTPPNWDGVNFSEVLVSSVDVYSIHGSAADDIWAVGGAGGASHWDGTSWTRKSAPTTDARTGGQELLRWDGSIWTRAMWRISR